MCVLFRSMGEGWGNKGTVEWENEKWGTKHEINSTSLCQRYVNKTRLCLVTWQEECGKGERETGWKEGGASRLRALYSGREFIERLSIILHIMQREFGTSGNSKKWDDWGVVRQVRQLGTTETSVAGVWVEGWEQVKLSGHEFNN